MDKNREIEEMAKDICDYARGEICILDERKCDMQCTSAGIAKKLVVNGYRKASEVAREVIDDILSKIRIMIRAIEKAERHGNSYYSEFNGGSKTALEIVFKDLAELRKKYTEGEG